MALVTSVVPRTRRNVELMLLVLAFAVALGAYALVGIAAEGRVPGDLIAVGGGLVLLTLALHVVIRWRAAYADPVILPIATAAQRDRAGHDPPARPGQAPQLQLGAGRPPAGLDRGGRSSPRSRCWSCCATTARLRRYTYTAMAAGLVLLLLPLVPGLGQNINGAQIWIRVGPMSFQPGELAKIDARGVLRRIPGHRPRHAVPGRAARCWGCSCRGAATSGRSSSPGSPASRCWSSNATSAPRCCSSGCSSPCSTWPPSAPAGSSSASACSSAVRLVAWTLFAHVQERVTIWLAPVRPGVTLDAGLPAGPGPVRAWPAAGCSAPAWARAAPTWCPFAECDFIFASIGEELGLTGLFALLAALRAAGRAWPAHRDRRARRVRQAARRWHGVRGGAAVLRRRGRRDPGHPADRSDHAVPGVRRIVAAGELDDRRAAAAHLRLRPPTRARARTRRPCAMRPGAEAVPA